MHIEGYSSTQWNDASNVFQHVMEFAKYSLVWRREANPDITVCCQIMRSAWATNPHQTGLHSPSRISHLTWSKP